MGDREGGGLKWGSESRQGQLVQKEASPSHPPTPSVGEERVHRREAKSRGGAKRKNETGS